MKYKYREDDGIEYPDEQYVYLVSDFAKTMNEQQKEIDKLKRELEFSQDKRKIIGEKLRDADNRNNDLKATGFYETIRRNTETQEK